VSIPLLIAGVLTIFLGVIHSILGRKLIFVGEAETLAKLHPRKRGIIWATWHLASLLAFGIAAILFCVARKPDLITEVAGVLYILVSCMLIGAGLVFVGTKGKHPGWIVLCIIAALIIFAIHK